jgi:alpha-N-acetylglucosaminidase
MRVFTLPRLVLLGLCLCLHPLTAAEDKAPSLDAARALVGRLLPAHRDQIDVEYLAADPSGGDAFEVETRDGRLVLRGRNGVMIGSALNWYLRNVAHASVSWNGDNLRLPARLPAVPRREHVSTPYAHRVYLNYCTFNYTASWWDRARWEREIDWMALNGINMPLAATGQEAVWQATLARYGYTAAEVRRFLVGPAFQAWQWMTNIEQWGGPLPQSWIDSHLELGRFIIGRERELGMTPILQGFTGCVPVDMAARYPKARILPKAVWCEVPPGTAQLDPEDPLFAEFGRAFLEEQTRLLGTDHLYAGDPFHEGEPPRNTPEYLHDVGAKLYQIAHDFDPAATIVMQGWTIREGIVRGIPAERLLVLDLTGQKWTETSAFWGRPWVAGVLHNFGGRHSLGGNLPLIASNAPGLLADKGRGGNLVGIGLFPEAVEHNPLLYALATDIAWHREAPALDAWVDGYVRARYGADLPGARRAWSLLLHSVYSQRSSEPAMESPVLARPSLLVDRSSPWGNLERDYDVRQVWEAWEALLSDAHSLHEVDPYLYDIVDVGRQALSDLSVPLSQELSKAWLAGDKARFAAAKGRFIELAADLDTLLGTRRDFLLGPWLADARRWGANQAESDLYERNARQLITVWGPNSPKAYLSDYAGRQWSGLISSYYLGRWIRYFNFLETQPMSYRDDKLPRVNGRPDNDASDFYRQLTEWEYRWCEGHERFPTEPSGHPVGEAYRLLAKWKPIMQTEYGRFDWSTVAGKH